MLRAVVAAEAAVDAEPESAVPTTRTPTIDDYDSTTWEAGQELILACDPDRNPVDARNYLAKLIQRYGTDVVNRVVTSIASRQFRPHAINPYLAAACREESKRSIEGDPRQRLYRVPYQKEPVTEREFRAWEERARQTGYLPGDWGVRR